MRCRTTPARRPRTQALRATSTPHRVGLCFWALVVVALVGPTPLITGLSAPASAATTGQCIQQNYPPNQTGVQLSQSTAVVGATLQVTGEGFAPHSVVIITLQSTPVRLATVNTDGQGGFSVSVTIPADTSPGVHEIVATGTCSGNLNQSLGLSAQITIQAGSGTGRSAGGAPRSGPLAFTGLEARAMVLGSVALTLAGTGVVLLSRRRRAT
jgi:hypothetical protein